MVTWTQRSSERALGFDGGEHSEDIVQIDIARAEAGAARDQFTNVDLGAVVRDVFELHQPLAEDMGVTLSFADEAGSPLNVSGHAQFLAQLVSNLVDNALKHGASGGAITMAVRREQGMAEVEVADRGPGIPEDEQQKIFEKFYQVDASHTRETTGTGLGLAICRRLTELMGGTIEARSQWAQGSEFTVTLPLHAPSAREQS